MAAETTVSERSEHVEGTRRRGIFTAPPVPIGWGAIFAGSVVALAAWGLLYAFGLAIGLSAVNPSSPNSLHASGIFTGIWSFIIPIVAFFVGGAVASRGANVVTRLGGAVHGLVVWGLVTLAGAWMFVSVVGAVLGGIGSMAAAGGAAVGSLLPSYGAMGAGAQGGESIAQRYDWEIRQALGPINQRLATEGKAAVQPEQIESVALFVLQDAARTGDLNREAFITAVTRNTSLSRADAEDLASRITARWNEAQTTAQTAALRAADATGKAFWGVWGVLTLGLLSSLAGSMIGVSKRPRVVVAGPSPIILTPPAEAHAHT